MILDDPYDDPPGLHVPDRSPEPTKEQLDVRFLCFEHVLHAITGLETRVFK